MIEKQLPVSILFLVGGYSNEKFDNKRITWLKRSLNDLKNQSKEPFEILISLNANVANNKLVKSEIDKVFPKAKTITTNFDRSALLNFEMLMQFAAQKYICFWSDHDLHHPNFLEDTFQEIKLNQATHACPLVSIVSEDENYINVPNSQIIKEINTTNMKKVEAFNYCLNSFNLGTFYGIWDKTIFKKVSFDGNEKFDWFILVTSSLEKGYVFFKSSAKLLTLRDIVKVPTKGYGNHVKLLPKYILDRQTYLNTQFFRFTISVLFIIKESNLSELEKKNV